MDNFAQLNWGEQQQLDMLSYREALAFTLYCATCPSQWVPHWLCLRKDLKVEFLRKADLVLLQFQHKERSAMVARDKPFEGTGYTRR